MKLSKRSFLRRGPVEDELRYLTALDSGAVRAFGTALKLKGDVAHGRLGHAFLAKIAQLTPVEDRAGRVEVLGLDLYRVFEVHVEGVARAVGEKFGVVLREHPAESLELDADVVVGCP